MNHLKNFQNKTNENIYAEIGHLCMNNILGGLNDNVGDYLNNDDANLSNELVNSEISIQNKIRENIVNAISQSFRENWSYYATKQKFFRIKKKT